MRAFLLRLRLESCPLLGLGLHRRLVILVERPLLPARLARRQRARLQPEVLVLCLSEGGGGGALDWGRRMGTALGSAAVVSRSGALDRHRHGLSNCS